MIYDIEEIRSTYKDLFEYSLDLIFVNTLDGKFLDVNDIALKTFGYERDDIPHYSLTDIMDKDQLKKAYITFMKLKKTGRQSNLMEFRLNSKDGSTIYVESYAIPLYKDDKIYATLGIARNITDLKRALSRIERSEEKYRFLYETTPYSIILLNADGIIVDINPTTELMFGYIKDELVGRHFKNISAIHQKYIPTLINLFQKLVEGEFLDPIDIQIYKKDGKLIWVNTQSSIINLSGNLFVQVTFHDITDEKIISQKLEESEEQYRDLYQNALACLWTVRIQDAKIIRANNSSTEFTGVKSLEELIDKYYVSDFFETDVIRDIYKKLKISSEISGLETQFKDIMGNEKTISVWAKLYLDKGIIEGVFIDITYLKIVQNALQESEERYRILFENSPYAIGLINKDGIIVHANSNNEKLSGYKTDEIVGRKFTEYSVFSLEHTNIIMESFNRLLKGEILEPQELLLHKKDGSKTWVLIQASILKIDNETVFQIIIQDISTQKEASEKLKESEEKYRHLFENSPNMIILLDSDGRILDVNTLFLNIFGFREDEIIGKNFQHLETITIDALSIFQNKFNEIFNEGILEPFELQVVVKGEVLRWMSVQGSLIDIEDKKILQVIFEDINERKVAEQKLKESEEKYRIISENANDLIIIIDENFKLEYMNEEAHKRVTGYSKNEIIGTRPLDRMHPEDINKVIKVYRDGTTNGIGLIEFRYRKKDGTWIWLESLGKRYLNNKGEPKGIIISRNVTERKLTEHKLKESEEKFRHLFENSPNMIILLDSMGKIIDANTYFVDIFNYKEDKIIGKNFQELKRISLENSSIYKEKFKAIFDKGILEPFELQVEVTGEFFRWMNIQASLIDIDGEKLVQVIFQDINERKVAEQKLKESEERYRIISENANDLIAVINEKFRFEYINEEVHKRITGYSKEDLIGKSPLDNFHPDDVKKTVKTWRDGILSGEGMTEFRYKKKDGTWLWLEMRGKKFIDTNGEPKGVIISRDITKSKIAEQKLKESEQKFRNITEQSLMGIIILQDNVIKYVNEEAASMLDYTVDEVLNTAQGGFINYFHPDDRGIVIEQAKKRQSGIETEFSGYRARCLKKSGGIVWIQNYSKTIKYQGKHADLITVINITDKVKAEQKLKESEQKYRHLFESSPYSIGLLDLEGTLIESNEATNKFLSIRTKDDIIGKNIREIFSSTEKDKLLFPKVTDYIKKIIKDEIREPLELPITRSIGDVLWISLDGSLITIGDKTFLQFLGQDITDRKRVEQDLKKSEEKYRLLFENSPNAIILANSRGIILDFNHVYEKLLGFKRDELIGKNYTEIAAPDHVNIMRKRYKDHLKGIPLKPMEFEFIKPDGSRIWINYQNKIIRLDDEDISISIIQDITTRKEAELIVKEELVKLKELDQIRKDLISRVSHELKTPLIPVISGTELLTTMYKDQIGEDALEIIEMIDKGGSRLRDLVEKLINVSRIEYNKFEVRKKSFNLSEIIKRSANGMKFLIEQRRLKLKCEIPDKLHLEMDELRIEEVITNLLSNAIKNTPPHGEINLNLRKEDNWAILTVSDTGVGLTEKEKNVLFTRFGKIERYEEGLEEIDVKGSGLGLYLCKEIIQLHDGKIWAESDGRNKGSRFTVKLPIK